MRPPSPALDRRLRLDVIEELRGWPGLDLRLIDVSVRCGIVELGGSVECLPQRHAAEVAARLVHGVSCVCNDIVVDLAPSARRSDQEIVKAALDAMAWDFEVPGAMISVHVRGGWITLEGDVDWPRQSAAAARCVRYVPGAMGFVDRMCISCRVPHEHSGDRHPVRKPDVI